MRLWKLGRFGFSSRRKLETRPFSGGRLLSPSQVVIDVDEYKYHYDDEEKGHHACRKGEQRIDVKKRIRNQEHNKDCKWHWHSSGTFPGDVLYS